MTTNRITLIGYVGNELLSSHACNGNPRTALRVATHYKDAGSGRYITVWHDVICWGRHANFADRSFVKGSRIFLEGILEYRQFEDRKGHIRYHTQIKVHTLMNLDR